MILSAIKSLEKCVHDLSLNLDSYVKDPGRAFSRSRLLTFDKMIWAFLQMGGKSLSKELLDLGLPVSNSAFSQRRYQIKVDALEQLFHSFTNEITPVQDIPILAVDGSDFHIPTIPSDTDSYFSPHQRNNGYNLLHLNALYDTQHEIYYDALIQKTRNSDERQALIEMMERSPFDKALVIADRGYESYNLMAHFQEHKWEYLIRIKDGATSMKRSLELPATDTYDIPIKLSLTRRQTKKTLLQFKARNHFKFIPSNQRFDYLSTSWDRNSLPEYYNLVFRIVRLEIGEGHYETLVTNTDYTVKELKSLYANRWGIETSFRDLKYSLGLISFHSKKMEGIYQEIFAHLSMYNLSKAISSQITVPNRQRKYDYQINFTDMVYACRLLLCQKMSSTDLEAYVQRHLTPIRPHRTTKRRKTARYVRSFNYRVA